MPLSASALWTQPAGARVHHDGAASGCAGRRRAQLGGAKRDGRALLDSVSQENPELQLFANVENTCLSSPWGLELPLVELGSMAERKVGCELEGGASGRRTGGHTGTYRAAHGLRGLRT